MGKTDFHIKDLNDLVRYSLFGFFWEILSEVSYKYSL